MNINKHIQYNIVILYVYIYMNIVMNNDILCTKKAKTYKYVEANKQLDIQYNGKILHIIHINY